VEFVTTSIRQSVIVNTFLLRTLRARTYADLVITLLDVSDVEMVVPDGFDNIGMSSSSIHVCKLLLQTLSERRNFQANIANWRAHTFDAFCLYVSLSWRSQVLWYHVEVWRAQQCRGVVQCPQARELVCGA
jgi:hypothetical protein